MNRRAFLTAGGLALIAAPSVARAQEHGAGEPMDLAAKKMGVPMTPPSASTPEQFELGKRIGREVVCLCKTCPKRTITDCDCGWAIRNQHAILQAVVKGMSSDQIIGAYREVYGDQVLAMLPNEGFNVLAWALPYAGALFGLVGVFWLGRRYLKRGEQTAPAPSAPAAASKGTTAEVSAQAQLARELEDLD